MSGIDFNTKVVGVTFSNPDGSDRQEYIEDMYDEYVDVKSFN